MAFKKPILLAPAGSIEALKAAVYAGANAVYLGGGNFNARAFATNFGMEQLAEAFGICRLYGVKVYITLNTLVTDKELDAVLAFVSELESKFKPDAYIVQDLGLISVLRQAFKNLPIHASTQMQLHSSLCVPVLKQLGISRVVLARELSREDIAAVVNSGIETEIFIHGAICVCQSGGCLMSSCIGGRSGNRGKCAQPCRQSYGGKYPLSLKDMCLAQHIPEICDMGVDCLKIEGRMKSAEYVYETVKIYRALIDQHRPATKQELQRLSAAFSRSGFTDGYYTSRKGTSMFGIRTEADKDKSRTLYVEIKETKLPVTMECTLKAGQPASLKVSYGAISAEYSGEVPQAAINRPLTEEELKVRLSKTGDTAFTVTGIKLTLDSGLILPMSAVNALRRGALEKLAAAISSANTPTRGTAASPVQTPVSDAVEPATPKLVARFEGKAPDSKVLERVLERCDRVELPLYSNIPQVSNPQKLSLVLPRAVYDSDTDKVKALLAKAYAMGVRQLTVPNLGMLPLCNGFVLHGDYPLNVTNIHTAQALKRLGFESFVISTEIPPNAIARAVSNSEYVVYGRTPLMYTENCIIRNTLSCRNKNDCRGTLTDKTGASFPVLREYGHRNLIYNSVPTYLLDKQAQLGSVSAHTLFFTTECGAEVLGILDAYNKALPPGGAFTRGALKRGGGGF